MSQSASASVHSITQIKILGRYNLSKMFRLIHVVLLAAVASAGVIKYEECGPANLPIGLDFVLRIDGFEDGSDRVVLVKGLEYSLEMEYTSPGVSVTLENKLFGEIAGIPVAWNGVDADACPSLVNESCPLKADTRYIYNNTLTVAEEYPSISLRIIWKLVDDAGNNLVCFKLPAQITNA